MVIIAQFHINYFTKKFIIGRAIFEYLAFKPVMHNEYFESQFLDEEITKIDKQPWKFYFDCTTNKKGHRIGVVIVLFNDNHNSFTMNINFKVTNNIVKYT